MGCLLGVHCVKRESRPAVPVSTKRNFDSRFVIPVYQLVCLIFGFRWLKRSNKIPKKPASVTSVTPATLVGVREECRLSFSWFFLKQDPR